MNTQSNATVEDIEGLGGDEDASWGDYPIDTMLIRPEPRTVHEVLRRIEKGSFVMDPDFQRDFIWDLDKQSKLIESVLMRIPLPVFYLAENNEGKMIVVDGLQRLSTFQHFVNGGFALRLPDQPELNGKYFNSLSPKLQNRIEDCGLILYIIDSKVPPRALLDIFERVNSGMALTRQQMRNCLYMGPATRFLKAEATTEIFRRATGDSLPSATMRDREMVNRFCAFQLLGVNQYKGDMDDFLVRALEKMNALPEAVFQKLSADFRTSLINNLKVFGKHAFRKFYDGQETRSVFNASLWDVMSFHMARYPESQVSAHVDAIRDAFQELMNDEEFGVSISLGTNQVNRVRDRFMLASEMFSQVFHA